MTLAFRIRKWARPVNHLDGRICPHCKATTHGSAGQHGHQAWHAAMNDLLGQLAARAGITEQDYVRPAPWTAITEDDEDAPGLEDTP